MTEAERYLLLALRLGRHVEGLVDSYYGPAELRQQVENEGTIDAAQLAADGDTLLAELPDGWLRDQVRGCATYAHVLAGDDISYVDEVEGCYGVRPELVDPSVYEAVHAQLAELLPGDGSLFQRRQDWRTRHLVDGAVAVPVLNDLLPIMREGTLALVELPEGEALTIDPVTDEPWWAFNYYQGHLRSRVVLNVDVPTTGLDLVHLAAHEVYPGHHTEHAVKEQLLVRDQGAIEESLQFVPTPGAVLSEGIAETGEDLLGDETRAAAYDVLRRHGIEVNPELGERISAALEPLRSVGLDAALMIHQHGASHDEAQAYIERWNLVPPDQAKHSVSFATDPTWRAYVVTYSAGRDLCRAYVNGDPARFRRLLTEHVRIGDLLAAAS
ncbi:MAG: hypothetical protein ACJ74L_09620 [Gaiellaceae bacterium]|jgi:hypothetical protein